jgi:hypothetical protein
MKLSKPGEPDNRPFCDKCGDRVDNVFGLVIQLKTYVTCENRCKNCYPDLTAFA